MAKLSKTQQAALDAIRDAGNDGLVGFPARGFHDYRSGMATGKTVRRPTVDALVKAGLVTLTAPAAGDYMYTVKAR